MLNLLRFGSFCLLSAQIHKSKIINYNYDVEWIIIAWTFLFPYSRFYFLLSSLKITLVWAYSNHLTTWYFPDKDVHPEFIKDNWKKLKMNESKKGKAQYLFKSYFLTFQICGYQ